MLKLKFSTKYPVSRAAGMAADSLFDYSTNTLYICTVLSACQSYINLYEGCYTNKDWLIDWLIQTQHQLRVCVFPGIGTQFMLYVHMPTSIKSKKTTPLLSGLLILSDQKLNKYTQDRLKGSGCTEKDITVCNHKITEHLRQKWQVGEIRQDSPKRPISASHIDTVKVITSTRNNTSQEGLVHIYLSILCIIWPFPSPNPLQRWPRLQYKPPSMSSLWTARQGTST